MKKNIEEQNGFSFYKSYLQNIFLLFIVILSFQTSLQAQQIMLPVSVVGPEGKTKSREFNLEPGSKAETVWLQVNNLSYDAKMAIRINNGDWKILTNDNIDLVYPKSPYKGIGGIIFTIKFTTQMEGFRDGQNRIDFKFNYFNGKSIGFHVVKFNVLNNNGNKLIPDDNFKYEDPNTWEPPLNTPQDIAEGKRLFQEGKILGTFNDRPMRVSCGDCHSKSGYDQEYFSFSNESIIESAMSHSLDTIQAQQIASFIRSSKAPRHGRTWNPPYQPGPQLDGKTTEYWAAGAGIDAVLDNDWEMEPYLFPNATSQGDVDEIVNFDSNLDMTELPVSIPLPDWKRWMPQVHPKALWVEGYFEASPPYQTYLNIRETLDNVDDMAAFVASGEIKKVLDDLQSATKNWIAQGRNPNDGGRGDKWRAYEGTVIDNIEPQFTREFAKVNLARWMATRYFEIMHDYDIESLSHHLVGKDDPIEGTRQWPMTNRNVYEVPPHFTSDNYLHYNWQSFLQGKHMSNAWYHLAIITASGEHNLGRGGTPNDWSYNFNHIEDLHNAGAPHEPFRAITTKMKMYQTRNNIGVEHAGWRMRYTNPTEIFIGSSITDRKMDALNVNNPNLRVKLTNALLKEWLREVRRYDLAKWPRKELDWVAIAPEDYRPTTTNSRRNGIFNQKTNYSDRLLLIMPVFYEMGVDCQILGELAQWCNEAWPLADWEQWIFNDCDGEKPDGEPGEMTFNIQRCNSITINWTDNATNETKYIVRRDKIGQNHDIQTIAVLPANSTSYTDTDIEGDTDYEYKIWAVNTSGYTFNTFTRVYSPSCDGKPAAPNSLSFSNTCDSVILTWSDARYETNYTVRRKAEGESGFESIAKDLPANTTTYTDHAIVNGTTYQYRIWATNEYGTTSKVAEHSVPYCATNEPLAAGPVSFTDIRCDGVNIHWVDNSDNEDIFKLYRRKEGDVGFETIQENLLANTTSYIDNEVDEGYFYEYRVDAVNTIGTVSSLAETVAIPVCAISTEAPGPLSFTSVTCEMITVSWDDNSDNEDGFIVSRRLKGETNFEQLENSLESGTTSYIDSTVAEGKIYEYQIWAYNDLGTNGSSISEIEIPLCNPTNVDELLTDKEIVIYPNPAFNQIYIKGVDALNEKKVEVLDISGRKYQVTIENPMDISSLKAEIYLIRIDDVIYKLIKL